MYVQYSLYLCYVTVSFTSSSNTKYLTKEVELQDHHDTLARLNIVHPHPSNDVPKHQREKQSSDRKSYSRSSPHAEMLSQFSEGYEHATKQMINSDPSGRSRRDISNRLQTSFPQSSRSIDFIPQIQFDSDADVARQELFGKCVIPEFRCNPEARYRSYSGNCNNLHKPHLGAHLTEFGRILPPEYDDQVASPRSNSYLGPK